MTLFYFHHTSNYSLKSKKYFMIKYMQSWYYDKNGSVMVSGILTDFGLMYVAARLGAEWSLVVSHLGLKQAEIEQIQLDNPYKTINQTSIALQRWRDRQEERADSNLLKQLFDALDKCDRRDLLEEIQEKYNIAGEELGLYVWKVDKTC